MTRAEWEADVHRRGGVVVGNLPAQAGINMAGQLGARFGNTPPLRYELAPFNLRSSDRLDTLTGMIQRGLGGLVDARDKVKSAVGDAATGGAKWLVLVLVAAAVLLYMVKRNDR